MNKIVNTRLF